MYMLSSSNDNYTQSLKEIEKKYVVLLDSHDGLKEEMWNYGYIVLKSQNTDTKTAFLNKEGYERNETTWLFRWIKKE